MSIGVIHSADEPALLFGHLQSLARHPHSMVRIGPNELICHCKKISPP